MTEKHNEGKPHTHPTKPARRASRSGADAAWVAEWEALSAQVKDDSNPLKVPYDVAISESLGAVRFFRAYWLPHDGLPGLSALANRLPESTADRFQSLIRLVEDAQSDLLTQVDPVVATHGDEAREVLDELESALDYLLDDGVDEPADTKLAQIEAFHTQDGQRSSALIQSLRDYARLAGELKERLVHADESFAPGIIARAKELADLLETEAPKPPFGDSPAMAALVKTRNRYLQLMVGELARIRHGARRVFRKFPRVVREVTSAFERRRRAARRRGAAKGAPPPAGP